MSTVRLNITLPPDIPDGVAKTVSAEIWDASLADAPAVMLSNILLHDVALTPSGNLETELNAPLASPKKTLIARVHISMDGSQQIKPRDLLTTRFIEIPPELGKSRLNVPVSLIT